MRHCWGEKVDVYEAEGKNLAELLEQAAEVVRENEGSWSNLTTDMDEDCNYRVTLYVH